METKWKKDDVFVLHTNTCNNFTTNSAVRIYQEFLVVLALYSSLFTLFKYEFQCLWGLSVDSWNYVILLDINPPTLRRNKNNLVNTILKKVIVFINRGQILWMTVWSVWSLQSLSLLLLCQTFTAAVFICWLLQFVCLWPTSMCRIIIQKLYVLLRGQRVLQCSHMM